jgi:hypothetical protein
MTLPDERYRAVLAAEQLLRDLCDPAVTPRVPKAVRGRAGSVLRHYPNRYDMYCAARNAPSVFEDNLEDLQRFLMEGRESLDDGEKS